MRLLYSFVIRCYCGFIFIAGLLGNEKAKLWWQGRKDQWLYLKPEQTDKSQWIWIHVSSLGEFEQGLPLIEALKSNYPQLKLLLTFFSPSGYEIKKDFPLADKVAYMPSDTLCNAKKLVHNYPLKAVFFVKYEFWFNYMKVLHDNHIPLFYISTLLRPNQYFFKFYGTWFRKQLKLVKHYFVQNEETAKLLDSIGIDKVTLTGDTRFDRVYNIAKQSKTFPDIEGYIAGRKCIIAGSSWSSDEKFLYPFIKKMPENYCFIMVPHDISDNHIKQIENQLQAQSEDYQLYTDFNPNNHTKVLIINTIGILSKIYRYARFAYIGGGFYEGIHNIQEAIIFGCPVVFGQKYRKFGEAVDLVESGGAFAITDQLSLDKVFDRMINDENFYRKAADTCTNYVNSKIGATNTIMKELKDNF